MKVDFVIAGTQKGGTRALDYYLRQHPELSLPKIKEVHFLTGRIFSHSPDSESAWFRNCKAPNKSRFFKQRETAFT